jgi:hypothetical protein
LQKWLFVNPRTKIGIKAVNLTKSSALLFSLIETAKANSVDAYLYIRHLCDKIPVAKTIDDYGDEGSKRLGVRIEVLLITMAIRLRKVSAQRSA